MTLTNIGKTNYDAFRAILPYGKSMPDSGELLLIGAIEEGSTAGAVSILLSEEMAVIDSLYVMPRFRRRGIGSRMVGEIFEIARKLKLEALQVDFPEDMAMIRFFRRNHFMVIPGSSLYYAKLSDFSDSRFIKAGTGSIKNTNILPMGQLNGNLQNRFWNMLYEYFSPDEIHRIHPDERLSRVLIGPDGSPAGYMLVSLPQLSPIASEIDGKAALVAMLYSKTESFRDLQQLFASALASEAIGEDNITTVMFYSDERIHKFATELLAGKELHEKRTGLQGARILEE